MGSTGGGDNLGRIAKNCTKITKSTFLGQNSVGGKEGGGGGTRGEQGERQANFSGSGGIPSLAETMDCINIREILEAAKLHFNIFLY